MTAIRAFCPGMEDEVLLISDVGHLDDKGKSVKFPLLSPYLSLPPNTPSVLIISFMLLPHFPHSVRARYRGRQEEIFQDPYTKFEGEQQ